MEKEKKISVIMGVCNANRNNMISESIQSICNQTYSNWELIICDDNSQDNSYKVLKDWSEREKRIKLICNKKNRGLAYSLNHCLKYATGDFIARMDVDDISEPNRFEYQLKFLLENEYVSFCATAANLFDENGIWAVRYKKYRPEKKDFLYTSPFIHATLMARKEFFEKNKYCISRKTLRAEDYELFMRAYAKGSIGINLQEVLYNIREDNECYSRRKYVERWFEMLIRYEGYKALGLLPLGIPYIVKPLIVGLIPQKILRKMRREDVRIK